MKMVKIKKPNKIVLKMLFIIIIKMMLKVKMKINKKENSLYAILYNVNKYKNEKLSKKKW